MMHKPVAAKKAKPNGIKKTPSEKLRDEAYDRYRAKQFKNAIETFGSIPVKIKEDQVGVARCLLAMGRMTEAFTLLQTLEQQATSPVEQLVILTVLANVHKHRGELKEATEALQRIHLQDRADVRYSWIRLHEGKNEPEEALRKCEENEIKHPDFFNTYFSHAVILHNQDAMHKNLEKILKILKRFDNGFEQIKPQFLRFRERNYATAQTLLSSIYRDLNQLENAFKCARRAIAADETYALGHTALGKCYHFRNKAGDKALADECFQESKKRDKKRFFRLHGSDAPQFKCVQIIQILEEENDDELNAYIRQWLEQDPPHLSAVATPMGLAKDAWGDDDTERKTQSVRKKWDDDLDKDDEKKESVVGKTNGFAVFADELSDDEDEVMTILPQAAISPEMNAPQAHLPSTEATVALPQLEMKDSPIALVQTPASVIPSVDSKTPQSTDRIQTLLGIRFETDLPKEVPENGTPLQPVGFNFLERTRYAFNTRANRFFEVLQDYINKPATHPTVDGLSEQPRMGLTSK